MQLDWEIWLNSNISPAIAKWLIEDTGWNVKSTYALNMQQLDDIEIYNRAKEQGKVILISKDKDFPVIIESRGAPPKLIFLKIENCNNKVLWDFIRYRIRYAVEMLVNQDVDIVELD